jgi:predicted carbohydrate-binding protein with CBM5 and CBM33 domain
MKTVRLLALFGLLLLFSNADAHGYLLMPPARNHLINDLWNTVPAGINSNSVSGNGR